jgi:hypothetical protein
MMVLNNKWSRVLIVFLLFGIVISLLACGDSDGDNKEKQSQTDRAKLNGIWAGDIDNNDDNVLILILNNGEVFAVDNDDSYAGTYTYSAENEKFTASVQNANVTVELSGTASEQAQIEASFTNSFDKTGSIALDFRDALFKRASSFELLSGEWASEESNYSIDTVGHLTGTYMGDCQITGTFSILDPERNLYALDADITQCETEGQYNGLAYLYNSENYRSEGFLAIIVNDQSKHCPTVWGIKQ